MKIEVIPDSMPGDFYCGGCDEFFSVYGGEKSDVKHCPYCGWDTLIKSPEEFEKAYPHYQYRSAS